MFPNGDHFHLFIIVPSAAPRLIVGKIPSKAEAIVLGGKLFAGFNGLDDFLLARTTFDDPLPGMWVKTYRHDLK